MPAKLLSAYDGPAFADPEHPGYGKRYLTLNGPENGPFRSQDTRQGNSHTISFAIPWEGIAAFRQYALNSAQVVSGVSARTLPIASPYQSTYPGTYATAVACRGSGLDANVSDERLFADCVLDVTFETFPYPTEGDGAYVEISYSGSADYDTIPAATLAFSNGERIEHDAGVLVGQLSINVTQHEIPQLNAWIEAVMPLKGKVNSAAVTIDGFTYPAGSLLFPTFEASKSVDAFGNVTATATAALIQRDIDWNSGIRSDGVVDTITPAPYQTADLNGIFSAS